MTVVRAVESDVRADDGHAWRMPARIPAAPSAALLWLPALGVAAKHYLAFAEALARRGVAVFVHEWRGIGSSGMRASRKADWGYRELLLADLPAAEAVIDDVSPGLPRIVGGHSLGGQIACCRRALAPASAQALWLVASGAPYSRAFPFWQRAGLRLAYRLAPWLADRNGHLPGRALRFAGNEARTLVRDWANTGLSGRYAARGVDVDLDALLSRIDAPVRSVRLARDWMVPQGSLDYLLSKMPHARATQSVLDRRALGAMDDHFAWMQAPEAVAEALVAMP